MIFAFKWPVIGSGLMVRVAERRDNVNRVLAQTLGMEGSRLTRRLSVSSSARAEMLVGECYPGGIVWGGHGAILPNSVSAAFFNA